MTPVGRLFVRNICMVFDRYLRARTAGTEAGLQPDGMTARVVVVGGGITGLAAAFTLQEARAARRAWS